MMDAAWDVSVKIFIWFWDYGKLAHFRNITSVFLAPSARVLYKASVYKVLSLIKARFGFEGKSCGSGSPRIRDLLDRSNQDPRPDTTFLTWKFEQFSILVPGHMHNCLEARNLDLFCFWPCFGKGSGMTSKVGSGSGIKHSGSTTLPKDAD